MPKCLDSSKLAAFVNHTDYRSFYMLKVRIIAALIAIVLTILTIYLVPYVIDFYQRWSAGLSPQGRQWFNWSQAVVGGLIALYGVWLWKKKKP